MKGVREFMNVAVSIIVPLYKVEKYFRKCMDSILAQKLENIEIILVDDGSPDRCGEMAEEYALIDLRIKVVHQQNGGLSKARNVGVQWATGDYIGFVDPDDWIEADMFSTMYDAAKEKDADTVICGLCEFYEDTERTAIVRYLFLPSIMNGKKEVHDKVLFHILSGKLHAFAWNKLYKRSVLLENRITSPEDMPLMQDTVFALKVFSNMEKTVYIDKPLYHFRRHSSSNSMKFRSDIFSTLFRLLYEKENCIRQSDFSHAESHIAVNEWFIRQILNATLMECSQANPLPFSTRIKRISAIVNHRDVQRALQDVQFQQNFIQRAVLFFFRRRNTASVIFLSVLYNRYLNSGRRVKNWMQQKGYLKQVYSK
jgi:glycosyltransferase involved in cell wall biosynthesis